jgi:hypothetical protein
MWLAVLAVLCALGLYALRPRPAVVPAAAPAEPASRAETAAAPDASAESAVRSPDRRNPPAAAPQPVHEAQPSVPPVPTLPPDHLETETPLLAEIDGHRGLDGAAVSALIRGDRFSDFMDRLQREAATSALALDLTELYAQSAEQARAGNDDGELAIRLVCGLTVCAVSAAAPSKDLFDTWFQAFIGNPEVPPYGAGRYDMLTAAGTVEHRIVFSSDRDRQHVIMPRTRPATP